MFRPRARSGVFFVAFALSSFGTAACSGDGTAANTNTKGSSDGAGGASSDADGAPHGRASFDAGPDRGLDGGEPVTIDAGVSRDGGLADDASPFDGAIAPLVCDGPGPHFATSVVSDHFGPGQNFGRNELPGIVLGPPKGGGTVAGSTDVASLGNGGSITLGFDGNAIVDGPGPDFIVFENPFAVGGNLNDPYAELATVSVSDDGETWTSFPCTATSYPYGSCAGWHYVYANADTNDIDPTDPAVAGGDAFDLHDLGVTQARFVRITDRPDLPTVFDLDAMSIVHGLCN